MRNFLIALVCISVVAMTGSASAETHDNGVQTYVTEETGEFSERQAMRLSSFIAIAEDERVDHSLAYLISKTPCETQTRAAEILQIYKGYGDHGLTLNRANKVAEIAVTSKCDQFIEMAESLPALVASETCLYNTGDRDELLKPACLQGSTGWIAKLYRRHITSMNCSELRTIVREGKISQRDIALDQAQTFSCPIQIAMR